MVVRIVAGGERAVLVAFGNHHQRAVDRQHLVQEDRDVHCPRLRHAVVARPGAVILVPLPHVAFERRLGVDLELVDVDAFAEHLPQRLHQARMMRHQTERFVVGMRRKGGARRAGLFAPDFLAFACRIRSASVAQQRHFVLGKTAGKKQIALFVEGLDLVGAEFHDFSRVRIAGYRIRARLAVSAGHSTAGERKNHPVESLRTHTRLLRSWSLPVGRPAL